MSSNLSSLLAATSAVWLCLAQAAAQDVGTISSILGTVPDDWTVETVTGDMDYPWNIERLGSHLYITEKAGNVVVVENGKPARYRVATSDPIDDEGGGGLLGMALAPDFDASDLVYLYQSYRSVSSPANNIIEAKLDGEAWRETRVLLDGIPSHRVYNGGRVAIDLDGYLYVTTGWTENRDVPQDVDSLAGKILRMTRDGKVPTDTPFEASYVYSYGHRNPQGLAWNASGDLYGAEHGQSAHDEINRIRAGANNGRPVISGAQAREGMEAPLVESADETWAPSGIAFAGDELLVAALGSRGLFVMDEDASKLFPVLASEDRLRDVLPVEDGIYVITTNRSPRAAGTSPDRLLKLSPKR